LDIASRKERDHLRAESCAFLVKLVFKCDKIRKAIIFILYRVMFHQCVIKIALFATLFLWHSLFIGNNRNVFSVQVHCAEISMP